MRIVALVLALPKCSSAHRTAFNSVRIALVVASPVLVLLFVMLVRQVYIWWKECVWMSAHRACSLSPKPVQPALLDAMPVHQILNAIVVMWVIVCMMEIVFGNALITVQSQMEYAGHVKTYCLTVKSALHKVALCV
jgi:hypothetical protein